LVFFRLSLAVILTSVVGLAGATDLLEVYRDALSNDAKYAAAKARFNVAQEVIPQARAALAPKVDLDGQYDYNSLDSSNSFSSGYRDFGSYRYGVSSSLSLYNKQNDASINVAQQRVAVASVELEQANQELMRRTINLYFEVLRARTNLGTVRAQKTAVAEQLELAKRNFAVGVATITDQREAQAQFDLVRADEIAALNNLKVASDSLEQLLGVTITASLSQLKMPIDLKSPDPDDIGVWVLRSNEESLDVILATKRVDLAQRLVESAATGKSPTVDLVGSVYDSHSGASANSRASSDSTLGVIGIQVKVPLFEGGLVDSQTRQALSAQETAIQELQDTKRIVGQKTRSAYLGVTTGISRVKAFEEALASTKLQLESTKLGLEVGVRTAVDVLDAERLLAEARRNMSNAIFDTILSQVELQAVSGRLVEGDLAAINDLLAD
jgi:outer membrane protein